MSYLCFNFDWLNYHQFVKLSLQLTYFKSIAA